MKRRKGRPSREQSYQPRRETSEAKEHFQNVLVNPTDITDKPTLEIINDQ